MKIRTRRSESFDHDRPTRPTRLSGDWDSASGLQRWKERAAKVPRCNSTIPVLEKSLDRLRDSEMTKPSESTPKKVIICHYPKVVPFFPQKKESSVFIRVNYWKKDEQRSPNSKSSRTDVTLDFCRTSGRPSSTDRMEEEMLKLFRGCGVSMERYKVPYVDLGLRCDTSEFFEHLEGVSSARDRRVVNRIRNIVLKVCPKDVLPLPVRKPKFEHAVKSERLTEMHRFDYKQTPNCSSRRNSWCPKVNNTTAVRALSRTSSIGSERKGLTDSPSLETNSSRSSSLAGERLILEQSSDEEDTKPEVSTLEDVSQVCEIVNLPRDIVGKSDKNGNIAIMDSERFLRLIVQKLNTSGFSCGGCGTLMDGKMMLMQLDEPL